MDGPSDCGIDAIYIDDESDDDRKVVYVFQAKYYQSKEKFDRNFEGDAIDKTLSSVNQLILGRGQGLENFTNIPLQNKIRDINSLCNPKISLIFCSNSYPPSTSAQQKAKEFIEDANNGSDYLDFRFLGLKDIARLLAPEQRKK